MKIFRDLDAIGDMPARHVGIGNFDGLHLGHRRLIESVIREARAASGTSVVMSFDPHPLSILRPAGRPPLITPLPERVRLLSEMGLDVLLLVPFSREFASLTAEQFVSEILAKRLRAKRAYVGANFHFGRGGLGDGEVLQRESRSHGMEVERVDVVLFEGRPISSTRIREDILEGNVARVAMMLGRPYALAGSGIPGKHRGKDLGFSTANLTTENELIPRDGIYVTIAEAAGRTRASSTYIGVRPTYDESERVIETHILDYDGGPLYGQPVRVSFCEFLREDRRFDRPAGLAAQIAKDVAATRQWFEAHPLP
jgi:riboflavin kinase/FMN adenylyltransferase